MVRDVQTAAAKIALDQITPVIMSTGHVWTAVIKDILDQIVKISAAEIVLEETKLVSASVANVLEAVRLDISETDV